MPVNNAQDGQVPGALPTFGNPVDDSPRGIRFRPLGGEGGSEMSSVFGSLSRELGGWEDRAAQDEGAQAGKVAGLDPNYRPDQDESIRGIALRNQAEATYGNTVEAQARTALTSAYDAYNQLPADQRNPDVLQQKIGAIQADFHQNHVFPQIQGQFDNSFSAMSSSLLRGAVADQQARQEDAAKASFLVNQNSARDTGLRLANIPSTTDGALADMLRQHDATVDAQVNQGTVTAVQAVALKDGFKQDLLSARVRTLFDNLPPEQKAGFADRFGKSYGGGQPGPEDLDFISSRASGLNTAGINPVFANRLATAVSAAEAATGQKAQFTSLVRSTEQQAQLYANYQNGSGGLAAPPGNSRHEIGEAADLHAGATLDWLHQHAGDYGLQFLAGHAGQIDPGHIQLDHGAGATPPGQTRGLTADTVDHLTNYMGQQLRAQQSQAQQAQKAAVSDISGSLKQIEGGFDVPDTEWAAKRQQYGASPDPFVQQSFQQADAVRSMYAGFKGQTPAAIEAQISRYDATLAKGADPAQVTLRNAAQSYVDRLRNDLNANPLGRAARDGVTPGVAPLDMTDPTKFAASLQARIPAAEQTQHFYGLQTPPYMTPDEKSQLKSVAATGGEHMVQVAATLAHVLGPQAGGFLAQVGGDAPSFAQMGRISATNGDAGVLRDAATAIAMDQSGGGKVPRPSGTYLSQQAKAEYGSALFGAPEVSSGAQSLAANALATQMLREGWDPKDLGGPLKDASRRTLQQAVGATFVGNTQYGGVVDYRPGWFSSQKVLAPPDVRADQFGAVVKAINDGDLKSQNAPLSAQDLKSAHLVARGAGLYSLAMSDPTGPDPKWVANPDGSKFTLDLNALAPALRQRLPNAYKGGL